MSRYLYGLAHGRDGIWEAFSLDFDLAVQGRSFEEVSQGLREAIATYLQDVAAEQEPARSRLLRRRVPMRVRLMWAWRFFWFALWGRKPDSDSTVWLPVVCPA
jgi:predicted RNase H-like HicB family nuclease